MKERESERVRERVSSTYPKRGLLNNNKESKAAVV